MSYLDIGLAASRLDGESRRRLDELVRDEGEALEVLDSRVECFTDVDPWTGEVVARRRRGRPARGGAR